MSDLMAALDPPAHVIGELPPALAALSTDSRTVVPGALYVALRGATVDGHAFVDAAVQRGAAAVVTERFLETSAPQIVVPDTRLAVSQLADAFYERPSQALRIVGVTGTNGKTTTVHLVAAILTAAGLPCATLGTLGTAFGTLRLPSLNTTPPAAELHAMLALLRDAGAAAVAMEVSSHALELERVEGVRFAAGVFTNLTRDHLDFHGTFENYRRAKRRLFELAGAGAVNIDDATGAAFAQAFEHLLTYGLGANATVRATALELASDGSRFSLDGTRIEVPLPGRFNVYNALAALAAARLLGIDDATAARGLATAAPVAGRMERFTRDGVTAIVDYAHTPDALENVLRAARETTRGKLIVVFGCGGDRDRGKRPEMGAVAAREADRVIVTSDNPRSEDPVAIARAIVADRSFEIELDRRAAIAQAVTQAAPGDTVVVAGKGHETYQIVGGRVLPFDDRLEVASALDAREHRASPCS